MNWLSSNWMWLFFFVSLVILVIVIIKTTFSPNENKPSADNNFRINFPESLFEHYLDTIMKFLDSYSKENPDEWYHLFISQDWERNGKETRCYIKFEITLGCWWSGLLYKSPELEDWMKHTFTFDGRDTFKSNLLVGTSFYGIVSYQEEINSILQNNLDHYEAKHPHVRFMRKSWGAQLSANCK